MAPHLAARWGDQEEEAATIEELGGVLLWLGIANAGARRGMGGFLTMGRIGPATPSSPKQPDIVDKIF